MKCIPHWRENRGDYFPRVMWASFAFPTLEYPGIPLRSVLHGRRVPQLLLPCNLSAGPHVRLILGQPKCILAESYKPLSAVVPATLAVRKLPSVKQLNCSELGPSWKMKLQRDTAPMEITVPRRIREKKKVNCSDPRVPPARNYSVFQLLPTLSRGRWWRNVRFGCKLRRRNL